MINKTKQFFNQIHITGIKLHTWVSIIMVLLLFANQILRLAGIPILKFEEGDITNAVNTILGIIAVVYPAWKNNSVTELAQIGDEILYALRDGKITKEEVAFFLKTHSENALSKTPDFSKKGASPK